jgi:ankyrin repeat protein
VKLLLKNGAELNSKNEHGQTPLLWATGNGYKSAVKLLTSITYSNSSEHKFNLHRPGLATMC